MKTRIDKYISDFLSYAIENDNMEQGFQALLDNTRKAFDVDSVSIIEKNGAGYIYTYRYESVSEPEYSKKGVNMILSYEEFQDVLHMYDDSPICERIVRTAENAGVSSNIIHYGFIREKFTVSDGSICFECFGPHVWSEEEKAAIVKVGKAYKMVYCASLAEGMLDQVYERIDEERRQYRSRLTAGAIYNYSMDITDGYIREKVFTSDGFDILESMGLELPVSYDEVSAQLLKGTNIELTDEEMNLAFSCHGLIDLFSRGNTHPEVEYYNPRNNSYTRANIFMYQDRRTRHIHGLFVAFDITEAKRKQEDQKQALISAYDAANQANLAKSTFLSNMSHDIRTPMNGIIGMTAIAAANLDDKKKVADCLGKISTASKHLLGIINDVLDMSKIESGQIELQNEDFMLPDLIDNILTITKPLFDGKNHDLKVNINNIKHEKVIGDRHRIEQVFINLISNAVKYTPDGGKINIEISEKNVSKKKVGSYQFTIEDNGIGMSEDFIKNMFSPFARAEDSRVSHIPGTGLGLAITRNILQMMNGTIDVESKPDEGTKFTVNLFLELQDNEDVLMNEQFIDLPVLVADDDEISCELTCAILNELGMKGEYVISGKEAVECVLRHHEEGNDYFAVILDWKMPGMSGLEAAEKIRNEIDDDIPIIIISAYDWSEIEQPAREIGVNGFLSKPLFKSKMSYLFKGIISGKSDVQSLNTLRSVQETDFTGKRVLLVEDNQLNAEVAKEILSMANLQIDLADNGAEAVEKISSSGNGYYDIVFMDIQMPVMNGYEAAKAIRRLDREDAVTLPIIAMTANAFVEDIQRSRESGMNGHISKPVGIDNLLSALNEWIKK